MNGDTVKKVPASSVRYGEDISTTGKWVYCAYDGDELVAVGATAGEARQRYRKAWSRWCTGRKE